MKEERSSFAIAGGGGASRPRGRFVAVERGNPIRWSITGGGSYALDAARGLRILASRLQHLQQVDDVKRTAVGRRFPPRRRGGPVRLMARGRQIGRAHV